MSSLAEFPQPATLPAICERNSKILTDSSASVIDYRRINLKDADLQRKSLACLEATCKPAFVVDNETLLDKIKTNWESEGLTGVLRVLQKEDEVPSLIQNLSSNIFNGLKVMQKWSQNIFPAKDENESSHQGTILACHPHIARLAIVLKDNTVKILTVSRVGDIDQEVLLKDKRTGKVTCLSWRPKSSMSIAVGSGHGILLWLLEPHVATVRPGSNMTRHLHSKDMISSVSFISWCPDGKLLACTCRNSNSFWIWNIISQNSAQIHRVGSTISFVNWSPCGQRLLTATNKGIFRIWETNTWVCEKWANLNGKCTNSCWSSCGSYLLFTVADEPIIYYAHFYNNKNDETIDIGGSGVALKCADLSVISWSNDLGNLEIGGLVSGMAWDPTNSRLAVTFHGDSTNQPYIALFHTRISSVVRLIPCGFIRGEDNEIPLTLNFIHGYDRGAILAVYWSSETISFIPLLFNQNLSSVERRNLNVHDSSMLNVNRDVDNIAGVNITQSGISLYSAVDR